MGEVIEKSLRIPQLYLAIRRHDGKLVGICPGFITTSMGVGIYDSIPFSDYGGPIVSEAIEEASLALRTFLRSQSSKKGIAYSKMRFANLKLAQCFTSPMSLADKGMGVVEVNLKVTPADLIWNKLFSKNRRQKLGSLERDGYQAEEARNISDLRHFYCLYYANMKHIGAPPRSYQFLENMWRMLYPRNLRIWLVAKGKPVGGIVVLKDKRKTYWIYAGLDRAQIPTRYSVIQYLLWKEIRKAESEGYEYVSLGGAPSNTSHKYYIQKMSFGGTFVQQQMTRFPLSSIGSILLQARDKVTLAWKSLPISPRTILAGKLSTSQ